MRAPQEKLQDRQARVALHSRIVRWMKIVLPVAALVLIAAIFLVGRERAAIFDAGTAAQIAAMGTGMRLDNPRFSGVTEAGDPFTVTADWALPDGAMPDRIDLEKPVGELQMGEQTVRVTAATGELFRADERLRLEGDVELVTSDGYRMRTQGVEVDLETRTAEAPRRLHAEGPRGSIEADRVRVLRGETDEMTVRFEGNVRVNWRPAPGGGGDER